MKKHPGILALAAVSFVFLTGMTFTPHSGYEPAAYTAPSPANTPVDADGLFWRCGKLDNIQYHRGRMGLPEANGGWGDRQCKVTPEPKTP